MSDRTVISIDLAYTSYASNGLAILTTADDSIDAELLSIPLQGTPDPKQLARFIAELAESRGARLIFLDGPQGWRDPSQDPSELRVCERKLAAPAKTGLPGSVKPKNYTAFVSFSIAVFDALHQLGWPRIENPSDIATNADRVAVESFPLAAWRTLQVPSLPAKAKAKQHHVLGRLASLQEFATINVSRPPTHDELQAIVAGLAGFPDHFNIRVEGVQPSSIDGYWREGFIISPKAKHPPLISETPLFTIREKRWYAWQMQPGYSGGGYFSPIHIGRFQAMKSGKDLVEIGFFNAGYADGVQGFFIKARVIKRAPEFVVLDLGPNGQSDRMAIISDVSIGWLNRFTPDVLIGQAEVVRDDVQQLLNRVYRID